MSENDQTSTTDRDEPPFRTIDVGGEMSGHFYTEREIAVDSVQVSENYEPAATGPNVAALTVQSELGALNIWMSLEELLEFRDAVDEVAEYVEASIEEELERIRRKAGKT